MIGACCVAWSRAVQVMSSARGPAGQGLPSRAAVGATVRPSTRARSGPRRRRGRPARWALGRRRADRRPARLTVRSADPDRGDAVLTADLDRADRPRRDRPGQPRALGAQLPAVALADRRRRRSTCSPTRRGRCRRTDPEGRDLLISCGAGAAPPARGAAGRRPGARGAPAARPGAPRAPGRGRAGIRAGRCPTTWRSPRAIETRRSDRRMFSTWPVPERAARRPGRGRRRGRAPGCRTWRGSRSGYAVAGLVEHAAVEQALTPDLAQETAAVDRPQPRRPPRACPPATCPAEPGRHRARPALRRRRAAAEPSSGGDESDGTVLALLATARRRPARPAARRRGAQRGAAHRHPVRAGDRPDQPAAGGARHPGRAPRRSVLGGAASRRSCCGWAGRRSAPIPVPPHRPPSGRRHDRGPRRPGRCRPRGGGSRWNPCLDAGPVGPRADHAVAARS